MNIFSILNKNPLFKNLTEDNVNSLLQCLQATTIKHKKDTTIISYNDKINSIGIVLTGNVYIKKYDVDGNEIMLHVVVSGDCFGEVFAISALPCNVVVIAASDCTIMYLDINKVLHTCSNSCNFHKILIQNLLQLITSKNIFLNSRIDILTKRSLREKILQFLHQQSHGRNTFEITMNRQDMANYLCCDRSALCAELSKMQKEKIIQYNKKQFILLQTIFNVHYKREN